MEILEEQVIRPEDTDHKLIAFTLDEPLVEGTEVAPHAPDPLPDSVKKLPHLVPETLDALTWFFWVDDSPFARFSHSTRYVFIDAITGAVRVVSQGWWPYINGEYVASWVDTDERWDPDNWAYSNVTSDEIPDEFLAGRIDLQHYPDWFPLFAFIKIFDWKPLSPPALPDGEAMVTVNGYKPGQTDASFGDDIVNATRFGTNAQIPRYQPQGESKDDIEDAIERARDGGADDILFYYTGHGGRTAGGSSYLAFKDTSISPQELAEIFQKFCTVRFKVVIDACYSGGFADAMMDSCKVDIFLAAAAADETSSGDWDPEGDPNPDDTGGEYSSGFWEDMEEIRESEELQQRASDAVEGKGMDDFVGWISVANTSAIEKDVDVDKGYTNPVGRMKSEPCTTPTPTTTETPPTTTPPPTVTVPPVEEAISIGWDTDWVTMGNPTTGYYNQLTFTVNVQDLTGGDYPITQVLVNLGGNPVLDSGPIETGSFQDSVHQDLDSGEVVQTEIVALNLAGQQLIAGGTITAPEISQLSLPIAMSADSVTQDGQCTCTVSVSYSATLTGEPDDVMVTSVVLKVNGAVWADSGAISTRDYHNNVDKSGLSCGSTYDAEVIATTSDGRTGTVTASITCPIP